MMDAEGNRVENGTTLGPLQEGNTLKASCVVMNTRPQPQVAWFRGSKRLTTCEYNANCKSHLNVGYKSYMPTLDSALRIRLMVLEDGGIHYHVYC
uniref:Uncharacterized protein n=1 Tax=Megaselia scalaris TaxID=36166 RepID=T1H4J3_MEGSC